MNKSRFVGGADNDWIGVMSMRPCDSCEHYGRVPGTDLYSCSKWECDKEDVEETENTEVEE
jgi:hypothetical protein